jgi:hypothetical protein
VARVPLAAALLALLTAPVPGSAQEWLLWPSPFDDREEPDQIQRVDQHGNFSVRPGEDRGIGQTFVPRADFLQRMDFKVHNKNDRRPGRVSLWKWKDSWARTVAQDPLFTDVVELSGRVGWQIRTFFPRIPVEPGATYFVEFTAPGRGPYSLKGNHDGTDYYPQGAARYNRSFQPKRRKDLWFRTFGPPRAGAPATAPFQASDPALPWTEPLPSKPVGRRDYLERVQAWAERGRPGALACSSRCELVAELPAFLYRVSCLEGKCDEDRARDTLAILRRAHAWRFCKPLDRADSTPCDSDKRTPWPWPQRTGLAYQWVRSSPSLEPGDDAAMRELLTSGAAQVWEKRELGSFNRALVSASGLRIVAELFPDAPGAEQWRDYGEQVWNEFWTYKDTWEDSGSYNGNVWWPAVLAYAEFSGRRDEIWKDPEFRALVERFFQHTLSLGVMTHFGDGAGWAHEHAPLVWLYERAAVATGEPRYRWLARRIFDYKRSHARDDPPRVDSFNRKMLTLARAYLDSSDDPPGVPPSGSASSWSTRQQATARIPESWGAPKKYYDFGDRRTADKLALRSGFDPLGLEAVFNMLGPYGHGHVELGALAAFTDRGSLLIPGTPYPGAQWVRQAQDESAPLVRRYWGGRYGKAVTEAEITGFFDHRNATVATAHWNDPHGWNVGIERRFLWVRDGFHFPDAIQAAVGPVWHAADVHPQHGTHWYAVYDREPSGNVWKYRNPERYALLYFVPRPDAPVTATLEPIYLPPEDCVVPSPDDVIPAECRSSPAFVVYQKWSGAATPGEARWFDTLLRPFGPELSPEQAASRVRVLHAAGDATALQIEMGPESWIVVDNPGTAPIDAPGISTDARSLLIRSKPDTEEYLLALDATFVTAGSVALRWPERTSVETGSFDPAGSRPEPE